MFTENMLRYYGAMSLLEGFFELNRSMTRGVRAGYTDIVEAKYHSQYLEMSQSIFEIEKRFLKISDRIKKSDSLLVGDELEKLIEVVKEEFTTLDLMSLIYSKFRTPPIPMSREERERVMKEIEEKTKARKGK